ncbi:SpoIIE family protein phosphatase [Bacteroidota bacterium]
MENKNQLEEENKRLKISVTELSVLNDIATTISSTQPIDQIIDQIIARCVKHLNVEEGTIVLWKPEEEDKPFQTMIRKQDVSKFRLPIRLDNQLTGWMLKNKKPLLINDFKADNRFKMPGDEEISFKSLFSVPMTTKGKLIGLLTVFNKKGDNEFTQNDQRILSIIAAQSAQVIESARLYEEEKALMGLREEMRMAKEIQLNLLPKSVPQVEGYQIAAVNIPARDVGGDYYDFIKLENNRLGFCLGDITGKGMPAAMLMANLQAALRSQTLVQSDCSKCVNIVNKLLFNSTQSDRFATLFMGVLDSKRNVIEYCNGGHDQPLHFVKGNKPIGLEATGLLLGCFENTEYNNGEIQLQPGELLVVYSDGITESMNGKDEEFGLDRLEQIIHEHQNNNANKILDEVLNKIKSHSKGVPQSDDLTLMIIKRNE